MKTFLSEGGIWKLWKFVFWLKKNIVFLQQSKTKSTQVRKAKSEFNHRFENNFEASFSYLECEYFLYTFCFYDNFFFCSFFPYSKITRQNNRAKSNKCLIYGWKNYTKRLEAGIMLEWKRNVFVSMCVSMCV